MTEIHAPAMEAYERCTKKLIVIVKKLQSQLSFHAAEAEIFSEVQERWISCYDDIFEDDEQYLRYMFVVIKNRMRNMKRIYCRYNRMHISDPNKLAKGGSDKDSSGHCRVWNEMAVDTKEGIPITNCMIMEFVDQIEEELEVDFHKKVFRLLVQGLPHKAIAEELGCSTCKVIKVKTEVIWPKTQEVMNIPDKKYEVLIDNGRIYS